MSLLKYIDTDRQRQTDRGKIYTAQYREDGAFFRGPRPPAVKRQVFEDNLETVADFGARPFDLEDPEQLAVYTEIMDRVANGAYRVVVHRIDLVEGKYRAFVAWCEQFVELPAHFYE